MNNKLRALAAEQAILAYIAAGHSEREYALQDLLCDLRHWADAEKHDYLDADEKAKLNYTAEWEEEFLAEGKTNLPTRLDQGLEGPTPTLVRQARSLLEGVSMPCGYSGCSYCDPDEDAEQ